MGYIDRLIADREVSDLISSPATNNLFDINEDTKKLSEYDDKKFCFSVQRLLYLAVQFRRDILLTISFLVQMRIKKLK